MEEPLATYLSDHLGGAQHAVDVLRKLADSLGAARALKEAAGWVGEKVSRLKLRQSAQPGGLGVFESLEFLEVGIAGKGLWRALEVARPDSRLQGLNYRQLMRKSFQNIFSDFRHSRFDAHSLISSANTSSSFPRTTSPVGAPPEFLEKRKSAQVGREAFSRVGLKT